MSAAFEVPGRGLDDLPAPALALVPKVDRELWRGLLFGAAVSLAIWALLIAVTIFVI